MFKLFKDLIFSNAEEIDKIREEANEALGLVRKDVVEALKHPSTDELFEEGSIYHTLITHINAIEEHLGIEVKFEMVPDISRIPAPEPMMKAWKASKIAKPKKKRKKVTKKGK